MRTFLTCQRSDGGCGSLQQQHYWEFLSDARLLNTAITRTKSLVAVVGEPVSLCTVGKCRGNWRDYIRRCADRDALYGIFYEELRQQVDASLRGISLNPQAANCVPKEMTQVGKEVCKPTDECVNGQDKERENPTGLQKSKDREHKISDFPTGEENMEKESSEDEDELDEESESEGGDPSIKDETTHQQAVRQNVTLSQDTSDLWHIQNFFNKFGCEWFDYESAFSKCMDKIIMAILEKCAEIKGRDEECASLEAAKLILGESTSKTEKPKFHKLISGGKTSKAEKPVDECVNRQDEDEKSKDREHEISDFPTGEQNIEKESSEDEDELDEESESEGDDPSIKDETTYQVERQNVTLSQDTSELWDSQNFFNKFRREHLEDESVFPRYMDEIIKALVEKCAEIKGRDAEYPSLDTAKLISGGKTSKAEKYEFNRPQEKQTAFSGDLSSAGYQVTHIHGRKVAFLDVDLRFTKSSRTQRLTAPSRQNDYLDTEILEDLLRKEPDIYIPCNLRLGSESFRSAYGVVSDTTTPDIKVKGRIRGVFDMDRVVIKKKGSSKDFQPRPQGKIVGKLVFPLSYHSYFEACQRNNVLKEESLGLTELHCMHYVPLHS